jgi:tellurite resistance protein TerC
LSSNRYTLKTLAQVKRLITILVGFTLLIIGVALIVLPGPAVVVIPLGLLTLSTEFVWARRLLEKFNSRVKNMKNFRNEK